MNLNITVSNLNVKKEELLTSRFLVDKDSINSNQVYHIFNECKKFSQKYKCQVLYEYWNEKYNAVTIQKDVDPYNLKYAQRISFQDTRRLRK